MHELPHQLQAIAAGQRNLVTRRQLHGIGWTDTRSKAAVRQGWLRPLHPGVYLLGSAPPDWWQRLLAAVLAAGEGAFASHRAALLLWGLVSWTTSPIEISAPHNGQPRPSGVLLHRSRRTEPLSVVSGIQASSVERTLLESTTVVPRVVTEKAFSTAWRRNLTSPAKCELYLEHHGGKGRRGTTALREVVAIYAGTERAAGSDGEVAFLRELRAAGIEEPVRQFEVTLPDGSKAVVDFAWPDRRKLIEFVGLEVHADSRAHAADTLREDDILTATGWQLRRFAPETLRRNPEEVARRVIRFLGA
jgi:very-short-patch-repair endonuclease